MRGLATLRWPTENNILRFPLRQSAQHGEEWAFLIIPVQITSQSHILRATPQHHVTSAYTTLSAEALLTVHLQRKREPGPGEPFHILLSWTAQWECGLQSDWRSSGCGHRRPDLRSRPTGGTSLALWRRWNEENWSVRLLHTRHANVTPAQ